MAKVCNSTHSWQCKGKGRVLILGWFLESSEINPDITMLDNSHIKSLASLFRANFYSLLVASFFGGTHTVAMSPVPMGRDRILYLTGELT